MKTSKSVFALSLLTSSLLVACGGGGGGTAAAPTTKPTPPVVAGNTCTSVATGTGVANFLADTASCGLGIQGSPIVGQTIALLAKGTPTPTGSLFTYSLTGPSWVIFTPSATVTHGVDLTAAGWVAGANINVTNTATTITSIPNSGGATRNQTQVTYFDLAGKPIVCPSATGVCAVPGNYPAGSAAYDSIDSPVTDDYSLSLTAPFNNFASAAVTDGAGVALTAMPVLGTTTFCDNSQGYMATVYQPITAPVAGSTANYTKFQSMGGACTAAGITAALAAPSFPASPETLSVKATGIAGVSVIASTSVLSTFFATYLGKVYAGNFEPAGGWPLPAGVVFTPTPILTNKTAINAELLAEGKPALP
jgi:hypothetical protein